MAKRFGAEFGLDYKQVSVSFDTQELVCPIPKGRTVKPEWLAKNTHLANFTPTGYWVSGPGSVSGNTITVLGHTYPFAPEAQKPQAGAAGYRIRLVGVAQNNAMVDQAVAVDDPNGGS